MKRSWIRRQFRTFERLVRWWYRRFTTTGKAVSLLALYSIPAILSFDDAMPFIGLCAFFVLLLTSFLSRLFRPRLDVELRTPPLASVGQAFIASTRVQNLSTQPALDLLVRFPTNDPQWVIGEPGSAFTLDQSEAAARSRSITALMRGLHRVPAAEIVTTFPMNLINKRVTRTEPSEIVVLPKLLPVSLGRHEAVSEMLGIEQRMLATAGHGFEYLGSREYVEGPVRRWDYASWARLGQPAIREFAEEADRQISLIVDTTVSSRRALRDKAAFDEYLACAFSVIEHVLTEEIEIALCIIGKEVCHEVARPGNFGHRSIQKLIATVPASADTVEPSGRASLVGQHSDGPVLVFLPEWNDRTKALIDELRRVNPCVRPVLRDAENAPADAVVLHVSDGGVEIR